MDSNQIKAVGNLLVHYASDLNYISNFIEFKKNPNRDFNEYCSEREGSFKSFINDFRVARNVKQGSTRLLLDAAWDWYKKGDSEDADGFADLIKKKLTHGRAISLASKIMFLMNPWKVLPLDSRAKESLDYRGNKYSVFIQKAEQDKKKREKEIRDTLQSISDMLGVIESGFTGKINQLEVIRENRFYDKWLWVGEKT